MRRRFSRRRRPGGGDGRSPIDSAAVMEKIIGQGVVDAPELERFERDDVPDHFAALARGTRPNGTRLLVSYAPLGGDALLGALAAGLSEEGEEGAPFAGEAVAIAPTWTAAGLQRLGRIRDLPFTLRAVTAPGLVEGAAELDRDPWTAPIPLDKDRVGAGLSSTEDRMLFARAASALEGLASKHGGSVRGTAASLELVVLARRVAELRAADGVVLETLEPQRSTVNLTADDLSGAFDKLEGQLRKRLNDRRVRDGEEGVRARSLPLLVKAMQLRAVTPWPIGGSDREIVDLVGIDEQGHPVAAAIREEVDLDTIGELLDMGLAIQPVMALLLAEAEPPLKLAAPRLAVAAQRYTTAAAKALEALSLGHVLFEIRASSRGFELAEISSGEAVARAVKPRSRRGGRGRNAEGGRDERGGRDSEEGRRPSGRNGSDDSSDRPERPERSDRSNRSNRPDRSDTSGASEEGEPLAVDGAEAPVGADGDEDRSSAPRRSRRRGRRRRGGREDSEGGEASDAGVGKGSEEAEPRPARPSRPLEVSMFDLDDEPRDDEDSENEARSRRRRGRRRGRGGEDGGERSGGSRAARDEETASSDREPSASADDDDDDDVIDLDESLTILSDDAPDFEIEVAAPSYDDGDAEEVGEDDPEATRRNLEREKRRRARRSAGPAPVEVPKPPPRRRAAILACDNRDSLLAAVLLARDLRLVEGIWVYPQSELMTFFRGVVTDQRDDTPLHVIGFTPSPAGEVLRTVPLYADRLHWYDHHEWAPEDLSALRALLPEDSIHLTPGAGSSLPAVLGRSTRRSRFSDKLVDLSTSRFTQHDFERWGRLWWHRLGEIASHNGDRRSDVDALLVGRPSDLAKEAAGVPAPPIPEEVTWVSRRDFRMVHFAGYSLVVLEVADGLDVHLAARVARERYAAPFSVARQGTSELFVLGADEMSGKRSFDLGGMLEHLGSKLAYVEVLADEDHASRFRLNGIDSHPERLDEIVSEIAMGRSTLES